MGGQLAIAPTDWASTRLTAAPLPPADIAWTCKTSPTLGETVGWPQLVRTVDAVWTTLPPGQRASAVIFTADYSEAGAINELGRGMGLPTAVSGHNSVWWWWPGHPHATPVVAVAPGRADVTGYAAYLSQFFTNVRTAATLSNPYGIRNQDRGGHVYVCTGPASHGPSCGPGGATTTDSRPGNRGRLRSGGGGGAAAGLSA